MNRFFNFSANIQEAFENEEAQYMNFSKLLVDTAKNQFETGVTKADANKVIKEKFSAILGLDEKASKKEVRRAIEAHRNEIFAVIEDTVDELLTSGWEYNTFFNDFVEIKNLAAGDENEFYTEDKSILSVGRLDGNHWDIDRQRLGEGESFRISTYWVGLAIYEEFEKVLTGHGDWERLVKAIYTAMDNYVNAVVYQGVMTAGSQVLPGSNQFYKTAVLSAASKPAFIELIEDVQAANIGAEVVIMGTKSAISKLSGLTDIAWVSEEDKKDMRTLGHVGIWEGTRVLEIPQVFAKNDTTTKMVDPNVLLIMPVTDNKFVKLVYEGDARIKEVTDPTVHNDMTYDYKYMTKLGVAVKVNRLFGTWNIVV